MATTLRWALTLLALVAGCTKEGGAGDARPPEPPRDVVAVPGIRSAGVAWSAPADDGGSPITSYTVTAWPSGASARTTGLRLDIGGLEDGTAYWFTVVAANAAGTSLASDPSLAIVTFDVPAAPGAVTALPGNTTASVRWEAPEDNGSPITAYEVTVSPGGQVAMAPSAPALISGLINGTEYTFTVSAVNAVGAGPVSEPSSPVVPATTPGAPTLVTAVADIRAAQVTWSAPDSGGSPIVKYLVTVSPPTVTALVNVSGTSAIVTGLLNGTEYSFAVLAENALGLGPPSDFSLPVATPALPHAPGPVVAAARDEAAQLTWTPPPDSGGRPLTGYTVVTSPEGGSAVVTGTSASVTSLANGTAYTFRVFATSDVGDGPLSDASSPVVPFGRPGAPTNVTAVAGNAQATVSWTPGSDNGREITSYVVTASPGGATRSAAQPGATFDGLTNGTSYTFTVAAVNAAGAGAASVPSSAVTPATVPDAPGEVVATPGIRSATVTWNAPNDNGSPLTGYVVTFVPQAGAADVVVTGATAAVSGLEDGTTYRFQVAATNAHGTGVASQASAPVSTPGLPGAPTSVAAIAGDRSATVSWTAPASDGGRPVTGYTVRSTPPSASGPVVASSSPASVGQLSNGVAYTFTVTATSAVGEGPTSAPTSPVTPSAPPVLEVVSGDAQSSEVTRALAAPVVLRVSAGGVPVSGAHVTIAVPSGASAVPAAGTTDAQGRFTTAVTLGRATRRYVFGASAGTASITFVADAVAPAPGTVLSLVNASHTSGNAGVPGPGPSARVSNVYGGVVRGDGTVYLSDRGNSAILALSPDGQLTRIAGNGTSGRTGDGGPALAAALYTPGPLALDASRGLLFLGENGGAMPNVVRQVDLTTGMISTIAGGGDQNPVGVPATAARLSGLGNLAVGPDRNLYLDDGRSILRVDLSSGLITTFLPGRATSCPVGTPRHEFHNTGGYGSITWNARGDAFISGVTCDGSSSVVRRTPSGTTTRVAGISGGVTNEGSQGALSQLGNVSAMAFDPAGNLYVVSDWRAVYRIEGTSGRATRVAGDRATTGSSGDWGPARDARFASIRQIAFDPDLNLYVTDLSSHTLRFVAAAGASSAQPARLEVAGGDGQSGTVGNIVAPLQARLLDGSSGPLFHYELTWRPDTAGAAVYSSTAITNSVGIAQTYARNGLAPDDYTLTASYLDIHGDPVVGSPATFTLHATAPAEGTSFAILNTGRSSTYGGFPGPSTLASTGRLWAVAVASDGTAYVSDPDNCRIYRILSSGYADVLAGTGVCGGTSGDGGPATAASMRSARSLALDDARDLLYIADGSGGDRIRVVDLASGIIELFAGSGSAGAPGYGDGGPATSATLTAPGGLSLAPDGSLYLVEGSPTPRIRRVDAASGLIEAVSIGSPCAQGGLASGVFSLQGGATATDGAGNLFFVGLSCSGGYGIFQRTPVGAISKVAGASPGSHAEGIPAINARIDAPNQLTIDAGGNLYFTDYLRHWVRVIDAATGTIHTVAGNLDGTPGASADYLPAGDTALDYPWGLGIDGAGHLYIADGNNRVLRIVW